MGLAVDLASVSDLHNSYGLPRVVHLIDNSIIALAQSIAFLAGELFAGWWPGIVGEALDAGRDAGQVLFGDGLEFLDGG